MVTRITSVGTPGASLVDFFPVLKHVPTWMAKWKREGLAWHEAESEIFKGFNAGVAAIMVKFTSRLSGISDICLTHFTKTAGEEKTCFASELIETQDRHGFSEKGSAWLSAVMV